MTGLSWSEARLIRPGVRPAHGRPYHPQAQGQVERLKGTPGAEARPRARRDDPAHFAADLEAWRTGVCNPVRPPEALGDRPPLRRWRPSPRPRPAERPAGSVVGKVSTAGDVRWKGDRRLAGRGIVGEYVRIDDQGFEVALSYATHRVRYVATELLRPGVML
jgi:hypothetical protein